MRLIGEGPGGALHVDLARSIEVPPWLKRRPNSHTLPLDSPNAAVPIEPRRTTPT